MSEDTNTKQNKTSKENTDEETEKSIADGRKAIEVDKKVSDKSEDDLKEDAEKFRNEG